MYKLVNIAQRFLLIVSLVAADYLTQGLCNSEHRFCDWLVWLQQLLLRICKLMAPNSWLRPVWTVITSHKQYSWLLCELCCVNCAPLDLLGAGDVI